jgi:hypothetical protein
MLPYSSAGTGCAHRILATMKLKGSQPNYNCFTSDIRSMVSPLQCNSLEYFLIHQNSIYCYNHLSFFCRSTEALSLWNKRCAPMLVTVIIIYPFLSYLYLSLISSKCIVMGVKICPPNFPSFSLGDLERMKDTDKWLSDSHVAFSLMFAPFFYYLSPS